MPHPPIRHRILSAPRAGAAAEEYEDAAAVTADAWPVRAAVADGATESVFAAPWAEALTQRLVAGGDGSTAAFTEAVTAAQTEWRTRVADRVRDRPWYVRAKVSEGAFAAVLGLVLNEDASWWAAGVGDCCLFHLREGQVRRTWPLTDPSAFTNRPTLVSSDPDRAVPSPRTTSGGWRAGDRFLLATDAVAAWLLKTGRRAVEPDEQSFQTAVRDARDRGSLRNDDATLLVVEIDRPFS